jgi:hypothetical protein
VTIKIDEDLMTLEVGGAIIASASRQPEGWWKIAGWPEWFDRDQAITALTVTELLATGWDIDDPVVTALREELR